MKRRKPFVIFYSPSGKSLVSHCLLDLLNQLKLFKPFQICTGPFIPLEAMHAQWSPGITSGLALHHPHRHFWSFLEFSGHFYCKDTSLDGVLSERPPKTGADRPCQPPLALLPLAIHPTWSLASTPLRRSKLEWMKGSLSCSLSLSLSFFSFLLFTSCFLPSPCALSPH